MFVMHARWPGARPYVNLVTAASDGAAASSYTDAALFHQFPAELRRPWIFHR
ncbi:MAG TPA: hypothetical protein VFO21_02285 [Vicinamibacterales bacterium]|nr:hypothetical protein [Vicinamibacterales bacterium]